MNDMTIKFELVTPERVVLEEAVLQATIPTELGEITVLPGHLPLLAILRPGVLEVKRPDGSVEIMSVAGGFVEVLKDKIIILADAAQIASELDEEQVAAARAKAAELKQADIRDVRAAARLEAELAKTAALKRWRKFKKSQ